MVAVAPVGRVFRVMPKSVLFLFLAHDQETGTSTVMLGDGTLLSVALDLKRWLRRHVSRINSIRSDRPIDITFEWTPEGTAE